MGHLKDFDIRIRNGGDDAIAAVSELLPRWIPVSERLPDEEKHVLICYQDEENSQDAICLGYVFTGSTWHDDSGCEINTPDFWMPLPEPPSQ